MLKLNAQGLIASPMASTFGELQGGGNGHWNMHHTCIWDMEASTALPVVVPADDNSQYKQALDFQLPPPPLAWDFAPAFYAPQPEYGLGMVNREEYYSAGGGGGLTVWLRTYHSLDNALAVERMLATSRALYSLTRHMVPRCQVEGCGADLSSAKHYHRRHKVCEFHAKAIVATVAGLHQRFCQQCSRFHVLPEFDEAKRSCTKRLADHNRRRRKPPPPPAAASKKKTIGTNSSSKNKNSRSKHAPITSTVTHPTRSASSSLRTAMYSKINGASAADVEETGTVRAPNASTKQKHSFHSHRILAPHELKLCACFFPCSELAFVQDA